MMRAGFGMHEITPPMGVELAGYGYYLGRCAQSVRDALYVRAVMLEEGELRALVISCDLLGLSRQVCARVMDYAAQKGVKRENVLIVSIHTHTGPTIIYHEGCGYVNDDYVAALPEKIFRAIDKAAEDLCEVSHLSYIAAPFAGDHIYNRAAKDGPVDRTLRGFTLERGENKRIHMLSAACHGVFRKRSTAVSADFAGAVNRRLTQSGDLSIYLNGLCGDIDPYQPSDERLEEFADVLYNTFRQAHTPLPLTLSGGQLSFTLRLMPVTRDDIRMAAQRAEEAAGGPGQPAARVARTWEKEMLEKFDRLSDREDVTVKYLLLGGIPVLALPFEGFTQIGMEIRAACGREDALMLGCAEELLGYLPTRDDISRGAYAALESTFLYKRLPVVPGEAERLGEEMGAQMKEILA